MGGTLANLRGRARSGALRVLAASDQLPSVRRRATAGLTVFTFHDVCDDPSEYQRPYHLATSVALFKRQVRWIAERYRVVHPDLLLDDVPGIADGSAMVTFDDGWAGIFREALPFLDELGLPSITFLNMAAIDGAPDLSAVTVMDAVSAGRSPFPPWPTPETLGESVADIRREGLAAFQGTYAARADLAAADGSPLVRYGNHLHNHWLAASLTDEQLATEYDANERELARYSSTVPLFAFPFGRPVEHFRPEQVDLARELGARRVFTSLPASNPLPLGHLLDRVSLTSTDVDASMWWYAVHHRAVRRMAGLGASGGG